MSGNAWRCLELFRNVWKCLGVPGNIWNCLSWKCFGNFGKCLSMFWKYQDMSEYVMWKRLEMCLKWKPLVPWLVV